jgi:hypothetical protein
MVLHQINYVVFVFRLNDAVAAETGCAAGRSITMQHKSSDVGPVNDPYAPTLLRAVESVIRGAEGSHCTVPVCGAAASQPGWAMIAAGLGVKRLSMEPDALVSVARALEAITHNALHHQEGRINGSLAFRSELDRGGPFTILVTLQRANQ